jgi:hypothetical protein
MLAADGGVKWRGLAVNGQYFFRWLNNFRADGPIPISSAFDHGFETVVSQFVVPNKWKLCDRTSFLESWARVPLLVRARAHFSGFTRPTS